MRGVENVWECKKCLEKVVDAFELCWNCGTSREGVEDASFQSVADSERHAEESFGGQPPRRSNEVLDSRPNLNDPDDSNSDDLVARALIWILRGLALIIGIWGVMNTFNAVVTWAKVRALPRGTIADIVSHSGLMMPVLGAMIVTVAAVAIPLGLAEVLRLLISIEKSTHTRR